MLTLLNIVDLLLEASKISLKSVGFLFWISMDWAQMLSVKQNLKENFLGWLQDIKVFHSSGTEKKCKKELRVKTNYTHQSISF